MKKVLQSSQVRPIRKAPRHSFPTSRPMTVERMATRRGIHIPCLVFTPVPCPNSPHTWEMGIGITPGLHDLQAHNSFQISPASRGKPRRLGRLICCYYNMRAVEGVSNLVLRTAQQGANGIRLFSYDFVWERYEIGTRHVGNEALTDPTISRLRHWDVGRV